MPKYNLRYEEGYNPRHDLIGPWLRGLPEPSVEGMGAGVEGYQGPNTPDISFVADWLNKQKFEVPEDFGGGVGVEGMQFPSPPQPSSIPREPREVGLAGVMQTNAPEDWQAAPGGRYRVEKPPFYALRTPEGLRADEAAGSWQDFNKRKYGEGYAAERTVGTPEYEAGGATSLGYSNLVDQILKIAQAQKRPELLGKPLADVFTGWGELGKSEAESLAAREARAEKEAQRRENAWLMQQFLGGSAGAPPSGGVSEKTLKTGTTLAHERRAQESAERADRRLEGMERRERLARPNETAIDGRAQRVLAEKGHTAKRIEGTWYVYKGSNSRTPIANSEQAWAAARKRAEAELRSGAP